MKPRTLSTRDPGFEAEFSRLVTVDSAMRIVPMRRSLPFAAPLI